MTKAILLVVASIEQQTIIGGVLVLRRRDSVLSGHFQKLTSEICDRDVFQRFQSMFHMYKYAIKSAAWFDAVSWRWRLSGGPGNNE
jgi:hypothetical protein